MALAEDDQSTEGSINGGKAATRSTMVDQKRFSYSSSTVASRSSLSHRDTFEFSPVSSWHSLASSAWMHARPEQTLIFLDWDDTLFPFSDLLGILGDEIEAMNASTFERSQAQEEQNSTPERSAKLEAELELWREAVVAYLSVIRHSCARCRIITNSKSPWVEMCIRKFHPDLSQFLDGSLLAALDSSQHSTSVRYADEEVTLDSVPGYSGEVTSSPSCFSGCMQWFSKLCERERTDAEKDEERTTQKHAAMRREASEYYVGRAWNNILCMGDAEYEHDAVQRLEERLRTKNVRFKKKPTLIQLAWQLKVAALLHPVWVSFDGDLDVDFNRPGELLKHAADIVNNPELAELCTPLDGDEDNNALWELECSWESIECHIQDWLNADGGPMA